MARKPKKKANGTGAAAAHENDSEDAMATDIALDEDEEEGEEEEGEEGEEEADEELVYDPRAYDCLHSFSMEWPCLSFDVLKDELGDDRNTFPHTVLLVAGTQATSDQENALILSRMTQLSQGNHGDAYDSEEEAFASDDDEEDENGNQIKAVIQARMIRHHGGINRVRAMHQNQGIVASWGDNGYVQVWDTTELINELATESIGKKRRDGISESATIQGSIKSVRIAPRYIFTGHADEGFALGWSPVKHGSLASGDLKGGIHCWEPLEGGRWTVEKTPRLGHTSSIEDIAWSPTEETVFASCSSDSTIRIWDTRQSPSALKVDAHEVDVNVISWNTLTSYMLASGADDGVFRIWDLRSFGGDCKPIGHFKYHKTPITSIEWCPFESSSLSVSSTNAVTIWDLAVERDADEEMSLGVGVKDAPGHEELPPQLMFQHMGQTDVKEAHWHSQIPGLLISTAADGFNIFKPHNIGTGPGTIM